MNPVVTEAVVAISAFLLSILCLLLLYRCLLRKRRSVSNEPSTASSVRILRGELAGLGVARRNEMSYVWLGRRQRQISSTKPLFRWSDHPSLISDAVENGWARFGFIASLRSPSTRSSLLGWRGSHEEMNELEMESSWEVCEGSNNLLQKIRFRNNHRKGTTSSSSSPPSVSIIRAALPLPGPGNSVFPPEAYFEIIILNSRGKTPCDKAAEVNAKGEKTKLIQQSSEFLCNGTDNSKRDGVENWTGLEATSLSIGLSAGTLFSHLKFPGRYLGSVGFDSNGTVFLDGKELVNETENRGWERGNEVIGCGFDPTQKKVFFTVSGEVERVIHCKSDEFGNPLYPTIGTNGEVQFLVNFGQRAFSYSPANCHRTPNPCLVNPVSLGYEDSKELFSMGRIDSQWLNRYSTKATISHPASYDFDDWEADLFDIDLEMDRRSSVLVT